LGMAPQAQALLSSLIANTFCRNGDDLRDDAKDEDEEGLVKHSGVEIIVSNVHRGSHAVYPHFCDRPDDGPDGGCSHIAYPAFDREPGGLISDRSSHVVYPHYADRPEDGSLSHSVYPFFEAGRSGLLGEKLNDDSVVKHDGIEIIASNDTDGHVRQALYYTISGSDPPHDACSSLLSDKPENSCHASYPVFGDGIGGLIGNKIAVAGALKHHSNEVHTEHDDIEMITNDGAKIKRSYTCNPGLGDESCGISGLRSETSSVLGICGSVVTESLSERVLNTSKSVLSGEDHNLVAKDTTRETNCFTDATSFYHASSHADPPDLSSSSTSKEKELASLLSAFQALPREYLLMVLEAATSAINMTLNDKCGASLHICTDCCSSTPPLVMT